MNQRRDPLSQISSRDALRVLRSFRSDPAAIMEDTPPSLDALVGTPSALSHRLPRGIITLPDGTLATGRRIVHVRTNQDGTQDVIYVEG